MVPIKIWDGLTMNEVEVLDRSPGKELLTEASPKRPRFKTEVPSPQSLPRISKKIKNPAKDNKLHTTQQLFAFSPRTLDQQVCLTTEGQTLSQNPESSGATRDHPSLLNFNSFHISEHEVSPRQSNASLIDHPVDFDLVSPSNIFPKSRTDLKADPPSQETTGRTNLYFKPLINERLPIQVVSFQPPHRRNHRPKALRLTTVEKNNFIRRVCAVKETDVCFKIVGKRNKVGVPVPAVKKKREMLDEAVADVVQEEPAPEKPPADSEEKETAEVAEFKSSEVKSSTQDWSAAQRRQYFSGKR